MRYEKKLDVIVTNSMNIGDKFFDKFKKTNRTKYGRLAIRSYNTVLRALIVKENIK